MVHLHLILKEISQVTMKLTSAGKIEIFKKFGGSESNTGSSEAQIAMFTERISFMTGHLQKMKKNDRQEVAIDSYNYNDYCALFGNKYYK